MKIRILSFPLFLSFLLLFFISFAHKAESEGVSQLPPSTSPANKDYVLGPQDVIQITVWDNPDLSGSWSISLSGVINFHFVGDVKASGLTPMELSSKLTDILANGYLVNPQVSVEVVKYQSQKVIIIGEVRTPGTYYLTKRTTLIEALSMAGGSLKEADHEVIIVQPGADGNGQEKKRTVDLRAILEGDLTANVYINSGETIFVPKARMYYVSGEVNKPGEYPLEKGTTVRNAITVAGGETAKATLSGIKIIRKVDGKEVELKVELDTLVMQGDTIIIPESFF